MRWDGMGVGWDEVVGRQDTRDEMGTAPWSHAPCEANRDVVRAAQPR